jgi:hypothetical protein
LEVSRVTGLVGRLVGRLAGRVASGVGERTRSDARWSPSVKVALRQAWLDHRDRARRGDALPAASSTGFRIFSQFEEDGIVLYLLASLGDGPGRFVDLGAGDGVYASNCANLAINFGFNGLLVDADAALVARGMAFYAEHPDTSLYPPTFVQSRVTPHTVNDTVRSAGFVGEIDLLSIDIDGNDYWVWEALTVVEPRVVLIETHPELGRRSLVAPYADDPSNVPGRPPHFLGASPAAMTSLARRRGYRLVAANRFGFNLFYVREDLAGDRFPAITVDDLFRHPRAVTRMLSEDALAGLPFLEP